jgi:hypothetical protein
MLPTLEGVIARRVLLNVRVDAAVARGLVPAPLEVIERQGAAVAGICLIRLEDLRPKGAPTSLGLSSENVAHRIAIRFPTDDGPRDGVFIWRRDTDRGLVPALGGRLFPGVHGKATFEVQDDPDRLRYRVRTPRGDGDIDLDVHLVEGWSSTPSFASFDDVRAFFSAGDCGFSCALDGTTLEGMQLRTTTWDMAPLQVDGFASSFYEDPARFPAGSVTLDGAVLMRSIPHEWRELDAVPELAGLARG